MKILLEEQTSENKILKIKTLTESECSSFTSFFINSGIFNVGQSYLTKLTSPNCPTGKGESAVKTTNKGSEASLNIRSNILSGISSVDSALNKISELTFRSKNS